MWMMAFTVLPLLGILYIAWHVWVLLPVANAWKGIVIGLGIGAFLLMILNLGRRFDGLPLPIATACYEIGTSSILVMLYMVLLFLVLDLGRLVHLVPRSWLYANWLSAAAIVVVLFGIFLYGNIRYKHKVRVPLEIQSSKPLPRDYKVVMMSDLHIGYHNPRRELARWVDMVNAEQPDFILIAGDIVDGSMRPLLEEDMAAEFRRFHAPVYACLGNHEYYAGSPEAQQFYRDAGIRLLSDSCTVIDSCIAVMGRDDRSNLHRKPVADLMPAASLPLFTILLDHQPYHLERSEQAGVDFQLSGHTHRGQIWPISWITDAIYECSWGSHRRGHTLYYVSSGIGIWGGKFRIGTQSEYVVATIKSEK